MKVLVLLHVSLVLECEVASTSVAVEMCGFLNTKKKIMLSKLLMAKTKKLFYLVTEGTI